MTESQLDVSRGLRFLALNRNPEPLAPNPEPRRGQAMIELAIFGTFLLFGLALIIRFGMSFYYSMQMQQEAFRMALKKAYDTRAYNGVPGKPQPDVPCTPGDPSQTGCTRPELVPANASQVVMVKDLHTPDPSNPFATGVQSPALGAEQVQWGTDITEFDPGDVTNNTDLPKLVVQANDQEWTLHATRFRADTMPIASLTGELVCAYLEVFGEGSVFFHFQNGLGGDLPVDIKTDNCKTGGVASINAGPTQAAPGGTYVNPTTCTGGEFFAGAYTQLTCPPPPAPPCPDMTCTGGIYVVGPLSSSIGGSYTNGLCRDGTYDFTGSTCSSDGRCVGGAYSGGTCTGGVYTDPAVATTAVVEIIDNCMADVIDPTGCAAQCTDINEKASLGMPVPTYCSQAPIAPLDTTTIQGLDTANFKRTRQVNDTVRRQEDAATVVSTTNINEATTVARKIRTNPNVTPDYPVSVDVTGPYIDATSTATRTRSHQWDTPQ